METVLMVVATLSIVAFVVGMFNPKVVKCKSRGKVALLYVSVFFISIIIGASITDTQEKSPQNIEQVVTKDSTKEENHTQEVESSIGKPIQIGNFIYTIQDVSFRKSVGDEFAKENADGIYMLVNLTIKNIDNETHTLDGSLFAVTDKDGTKYEFSTNASTALEMSGKKTLFLKECQPNITTKGLLVFEVPEKGIYYLHLIGSFWGVESVRVLLK